MHIEHEDRRENVRAKERLSNRHEDIRTQQHEVEIGNDDNDVKRRPRLLSSDGDETIPTRRQTSELPKRLGTRVPNNVGRIEPSLNDDEEDVSIEDQVKEGGVPAARTGKYDYQSEIVRLQQKMARLQGKVSSLQKRVTFLQTK